VRVAASTSLQATASTGVGQGHTTDEAGNAGRGKGEDGEVKVIGDEPDNTDSDPDPSEKAVS
jgi:hypothetical protein